MKLVMLPILIHLITFITLFSYFCVIEKYRKINLFYSPFLAQLGCVGLIIASSFAFSEHLKTEWYAIHDHAHTIVLYTSIVASLCLFAIGYKKKDKIGYKDKIIDASLIFSVVLTLIESSIRYPHFLFISIASMIYASLFIALRIYSIFRNPVAFMSIILSSASVGFYKGASSGDLYQHFFESLFLNLGTLSLIYILLKDFPKGYGNGIKEKIDQ